MCPFKRETGKFDHRREERKMMAEVMDRDLKILCCLLWRCPIKEPWAMTEALKAGNDKKMDSSLEPSKSCRPANTLVPD